MTAGQGRGYIVAEVTVHDHETYEQYVERSGPVLEKYGARLLAHAFPAQGELVVREGGREFERLVLVEFESLERVTEFYDSADYQAVVGFRHDSATSHVYHLQGIEA
ncbi:DUF1330 domain-containing protein [Aeromicrobium sp. SMF47]|uniref:DUF1330 domain-containing protein n=1 Tax=Aeromicrobium TaxID=2040 RepID=UPI00129E087E|nr:MULTISPECIES: DUF1330 domain-containing protein [Aeromicrobium]MRJ75791.1 DUF1330 domain-containing protein [Aeromicrobium yanjiei]MRK00135.1 DUF1330 domain-containing protein [Aeromicrobium sp. S22]